MRAHAQPAVYQPILAAAADSTAAENRAQSTAAEKRAQQRFALGLPEPEMPPDFCCVITGEVMVDPVLASDGFTYERVAIQRWMRQCGWRPRSPVTNESLQPHVLIPNHRLKSLMNDYEAQVHSLLVDVALERRVRHEDALQQVAALQAQVATLTGEIEDLEAQALATEMRHHLSAPPAALARPRRVLAVEPAAAIEPPPVPPPAPEPSSAPATPLARARGSRLTAAELRELRGISGESSGAAVERHTSPSAGERKAPQHAVVATPPSTTPGSIGPRRHLRQPLTILTLDDEEDVVAPPLSPTAPRRNLGERLTREDAEEIRRYAMAWRAGCGGAQQMLLEAQ